MAVVLATVVYLVEVLIFSHLRAPSRDQTLAKRMEVLEESLAVMKARLEMLEARPPVDSALDTQGTTYAEAVRMARNEEPPQVIMERLGISRSEAELIIALHKVGS